MGKSLLAAALAAAVVAAPAAGKAWQQGTDPELGLSVENNVDVQVVDPNPNYAGIPAPGSNGRRTSDAMVRYETGKLKPLLRTNGKNDIGGQGGAQDTPTVSIPLLNTGSPN